MMIFFRGEPQVLILIALAAAAAVSNFWAMSKGPRILAQMNGARAGLACGYIVAYTVLLFNLDNRANWSIFMSDVAYVSWPVVWILPAFYTTRRWRAATRDLHQAGKYEDHV